LFIIRIEPNFVVVKNIKLVYKKVAFYVSKTNVKNSYIKSVSLFFIFICGISISRLFIKEKIPLIKF